MTSKEVETLIGKRQVIRVGAGNSRLIVFVHGWTTNASRFVPLCQALLEDFGADCPDLLPIDYSKDSGRFSNADPVKIANTIAHEISLNVQESGYESILLVGWSIGGVLLREAILQNSEGTAGVPFLDKIERVVLLASTNRGFIPSGFVQKLSAWIVKPLPVCNFIKSAMKAAPFILNLRMRWIRRFESDGGMAPPTVQVLGSDDTIVSRDDSEDIFRFANSASVVIPGRGHFDLIDVEGASDILYKRLKDSMFEKLSLLARQARESPKHYVFLVHGIRDYGGWTAEVKKKLSELDENPGELISYRYRYGYFNIVSFLLPFVRRKASREFVDRYLNALAKYPAARFHFVGHSNGTFLFGEALKMYDGVEFESAYLAGSVLPSEYDWMKVFDSKRLIRLRNDCASKDVPVGFLCGFLRSFGRNLGLGGFRGFHLHPAKNFHQLQWIDGGHGAALTGPERAASIARWVVEDDYDLREPSVVNPVGWLDRLSKWAFPVGVVAVIGLMVIGVLIFLSFPGFYHAAFVGYALMILLIMAYF